MYVGKRDVRQRNIQLVLNYIYENQPISRADISNQTGFNKASVSEITRTLLDSKIIVETGIGKSSHVGGRKPIFLEVNHKFGTVIGIDIGINSIRFKQMLLNHEEVHAGHVVTNLKDISNQVYEILRNLLDINRKVLACTISIQGVVSDNKIIFTPNYNIIDIESLASQFDFPFIFENEANLAAFAHSVEFNSSNLAVITLRTGIGAGIIFDEGIYFGSSNSAGEIGHTIVFPMGRQCPCGNKGCLEQYASEKILMDNYKLLKNDNHLIIDDLISDYYNDDKEVQTLLDDFTTFLSIGVNNFFTMYDIPRIYLVSNIFNKIPELVDQIEPKLHSVFTKDREILQSPFGKYASTVGACMYSIKSFLEHHTNYL